jgi:predicted secreted protein
MQIPNQAAGILLVGKDYDKMVLRKIFDPLSKRLTDEALDSCHLAGINPNDLYEKSLDFFKQGSESGDIATMRHMHYEKRRKNKMAIIFNFIQNTNNPSSARGGGQ